MDFCRNVSVPGGLPSEYPAEQVLSPPCSKLGGLTGTLDDLFSGHNTEVDVSLEWLSIFVEDCLSSTGNCLPAAAAAPTNLENSSSTILPKPSKPSLQQQLQKPQQINPPTSSLRRFVIPSKARSKRKRAPTPKNITKPLLTSWAHHFNHHPQNQDLHINNPSSDPPLLQQAYWLADSELINVPKPKPKEEEDIIISRGNSSSSSSSMRDIDEVVLKEETKEEEEEEEEEEKMVGSKERSSSSIEGSSNGQARRCTHCLAQRTPQWRAGPLGPKTLCNACGVRYKSGRLLPEYRPAKSPTFVSYLHSNSHKKVMEMRMSLLSSIPTQQ